MLKSTEAHSARFRPVTLWALALQDLHGR